MLLSIDAYVNTIAVEYKLFCGKNILGFFAISSYLVDMLVICVSKIFIGIFSSNNADKPH